MSRLEKPEAGGSAGFTLIEALAALAVMGAGLAAIGALSNASLRAGLYTERHLAEVESARKIFSGMPGREALPYGRMTGQIDGHDWRIESEPFPTTAGGGGALWVPQSISLVVQSPFGATIEIDAVRLRRQAAK